MRRTLLQLQVTAASCQREPSQLATALFSWCQRAIERGYPTTFAPVAVGGCNADSSASSYGHAVQQLGAATRHAATDVQHQQLQQLDKPQQQPLAQLGKLLQIHSLQQCHQQSRAPWLPHALPSPLHQRSVCNNSSSSFCGLSLPQLQQQRGVKQLLRPHSEAPKLPPRFRRPSKDGRLNRMVIRIPPQVQVDLQDGKLTLTGKAGSTSVNLAHLDPSGMVAWQCHAQDAAGAAAGPGTGSLLLLVSPSTRHWRSIQTHIDNAVHGVMQGYLVGLTVQGVGYRLEPVPDHVVTAAMVARRGEAAASAADGSDSSSGSKRRLFWEQEAEKTNIAYPHKQPAKAVRLKVGYTRAAIFPLPPGVLAFFVKPTLMYLYGVDKQLVTNTAAAIRAVRKPNAYTGNGIQLVGETIRLKQRAGSK